MKKTFNFGKCGGFSLIETLILGFIGITLLVLVVGLVNNSKKLAKTVGCINNMKTIVQAIENYQADWQDSPASLEGLYPAYVQSEDVFHCPADTNHGNSYDDFYIPRFFSEEDGEKVFLTCSRHYGGKKTVAAYLSYAVDVGETQKAYWSGMPVKYGETYTGGILNFADGTEVTLNATADVLSSFKDSAGRIYSVINIPNQTGTSTIDVDHHGDSRFEVITPAVIAGVAGTDFTIDINWPPQSTLAQLLNYILGYQYLYETTVSVADGEVEVTNRSNGAKSSVKTNESITAKVEPAFNISQYSWLTWLRSIIQQVISARPPRVTINRN
jgi:competence protein ComGC